ncbi:hypothetical protein CEN41_01945 [Fischerella thermalis CCMEE 5330]|uniref:Uncharacterized protein n=1 Tax=Fischerella thermalis CCMEE 5330 TaxID=2019670 RepID=A0A2N6MNK2_9CYAN|nr:hypothetical protein CEN41_01945 [Fischerella thermalis CCMEE 5330]
MLLLLQELIESLKELIQRGEETPPPQRRLVRPLRPSVHFQPRLIRHLFNPLQRGDRHTVQIIHADDQRHQDHKQNQRHNNARQQARRDKRQARHRVGAGERAFIPQHDEQQAQKHRQEHGPNKRQPHLPAHLTVVLA